VSNDWPEITYAQALAAYEAGQKLHIESRIYLVRPVPRQPEAGAGAGPVLWVTDERTLGDHGLLLYPEGRIETR